MDELQKRRIELLNDMYQSQSEEFKKQYRDNYFELLQYLSRPCIAISFEDIERAKENYKKWIK